ncbi:hypothetical protein H5410_001090 [Solanum commersonii]|uniref:Uncharacterized protein n=1 Tax=Solanum commersonii TaxID=4109 RepID=A0A9J6AXP2_SOLCO|nr:hypothetical protein H5410_001090 [Solanum commersonii]
MQSSIHVNGTTLRFTIRDFAIIIGLKFEKPSPRVSLVEKFDNKNQPRSSIDRKDFDLVESRYIDYPWGKRLLTC